jgi:hypothetical protein
MDVGEMKCGGVYWIQMAHDRDQRKVLVNPMIKLRVPENIGKYLISYTTRHF